MDRGKTKFMPNNDKKETFFFVLENELENANKECRKQEINMQNKLDMLFQLFRAIGGPNHTIMEYSLLNRCTHKARHSCPMAYCLAGT